MIEKGNLIPARQTCTRPVQGSTSDLVHACVPFIYCIHKHITSPVISIVIIKYDVELGISP